MITKSDCYLFSVYNENRAYADNRAAHEHTKVVLNSFDVPYSECIGHYQGKEEQSFLVIGKANEKLVSNLCKRHAQDSYLHMHNDNFSELVYFDEREPLTVGTMVEVPEKEALRLRNYTYQPNTGRYYTTK